ncbi:hypothetical protein EUX98_g8005 [Antrodiella citrinella]|uniref:Uncharacterized protein n=1 Tax=Antrodiella citrinella TaxID=2447956 RepID=A0A4S4MJ20_9APHY|nr:hypothetical protein EUX98_g8005 [Antrodiella citrinella]
MYSLHNESEDSIHSQSTHYTEEGMDDVIRVANLPDETRDIINPAVRDPEAMLGRHTGTADDDFDRRMPSVDLSLPDSQSSNSGGSSTSSVLGKRKSDADLDLPSKHSHKRSAHKEEPNRAEFKQEEPKLHILANFTLLKTKGIFFGIQWEFERLKGDTGNVATLNQIRCCKTYEEQAELLYQLLAEHKMDLYGAEALARSPWSELELERLALAQDPTNGLLGCNDSASFTAHNPHWYGGKVHFCCKLTCEGGKPEELKLTLQALHL